MDYAYYLIHLKREPSKQADCQCRRDTRFRFRFLIFRTFDSAALPLISGDMRHNKWRLSYRPPNRSTRSSKSTAQLLEEFSLYV